MNKPEFKDELAKTKIRAHKTFDGKTVEILYGAKDDHGDPVQAKEDVNDGHGRWFGIEVKGDYRMFSWKHSAEEGGEVEYGTSHQDTALEDMEADIQKRLNIARQAEILSRHYEGEDTAEKMDALQKEWEALETWNVPAEEELIKRYNKAFGEFAPRQEESRKNLEAKQAIAEKADKVREMPSFKDARAELQNLRNAMDEIGSAGEKADNEFRAKLSAIDKEIRGKQQEYFANLDANHSDAKAKKEQLLQDAKDTVAKVSNWKNAAEKLNGIFDEWKAAGSAGHDEDEVLWKSFNEVRQEFRKNRQAFFSKRDEEHQSSIDKKKALIEEAGKISASGVFDRKNTERMKEIDKEWRAAGFSGREQNDTLWDEFNKTKEVFWDAKKQDAMKKIQGGLDKKQQIVDEMKKKIEDMHFQISIAPNPAMKEDLERELHIRENELSQAEDDVAAEQKRLDS
jgi:hypothetical protein